MSKFKYFKEMGPYISMGWIFPSSIIVGLIIGYYFDKLFHTKPVGLLLFLLFGIIAGFVNLFRMSMHSTKKDTDKKNEH
ncbi:MAG: hypothetical protein A2Y62_18695 [Candidatus Fischerbacteria bacterium RBG_13_37_8]|uniref:F0F1 ATP synthase subunit n=1 Tax=Candidatus Fischerbacteria bacterium RBG_13_37_8 TaxID=1817863 RepID=A0A1F5VQA5_9BACT|nr:MAG: hypothetical protein A2Y62_18695 [Candidatus Fischerbacteria bacterium RBG_13_37_8]